MALSTTYQVRVKADLTGANDLGTPNFPLDFNNILKMDSGTTSSKADLLFSDTRTLAASGTEDLDLAGGLTDPLGATLTFVKVKMIYIRAASGNTNEVQIKPASANGFLGPFNAAADQISLPATGEVMLFAPVAGWTVTAGTGDLLTITNSAGSTSVDYDIVIIGTSA